MSSIAKGVLSFELDKKSNAIGQIDQFKWVAASHVPIGCTDFLEIRCEPIESSRTALWSCTAVGTLAVTSSTDIRKQSVYRLWSASFSNRRVVFTDQFASSDRAKAEMIVWNPNVDQIHIEITSSFYTDLADPGNLLIEDSSDATLLKIDGEEIWLPKKHLECYSPFFATLFRSDFREKSQGFCELKGPKLKEFIHFIGIVFSINDHIDDLSVEYLLWLGDLYQCRLVMKRCEEFLKTDKNLTSLKKLLLVDRFQLHSIVAEVAMNLTVDEIKTINVDSLFSTTVSHMLLQKCQQLI
ncbi:hypothetical protein L596_013216 [Steinernema carpocapsae]|uniref:BTB domain-containing protein n=1 Tax=Steinernema carpocapsae TaxID=34508 RepID=A0A4U5NZG1_STECR|nr:hypothetical protein L596_013216 [Steinernema carpocapsae]